MLTEQKIRISVDTSDIRKTIKKLKKAAKRFKKAKKELMEMLRRDMD